MEKRDKVIYPAQQKKLFGVLSAEFLSRGQGFSPGTILYP